MRKLLLLVLVLGGLAVFTSYAAFDDPVVAYRDLYEDARCRLDRDRLCDASIRMTAPAVNVLFVDRALADREGRQVAVLAEAWPYCRDETGEVYEIPQYFETDFASIPSWAQFYIKPSESSVVGAAIVHDWLYAFGGEDRASAKGLADTLFRVELGTAGVNPLKRYIMYFAVSLFGGGSFGSDEEMRFRDPATGRAFTQPRPDSLVIGAVEPGCDAFIEQYWENRPEATGISHELAPVFIEEWIDLTP